MNPLLAQPNQAQNLNAAKAISQEQIKILKNIKKSVEGLKALTSPEEALKYLTKDNPQMQQAVQFAQQCGNDPKAAMELLARQNGIDVKQIYDALK